MLSQRESFWIDDLPVCKQSGVGSATNQIYREDGNRQEDHPFEDLNFHCKVDNNFFLYAVFDGHEGTRAVDFCVQRMPADILFAKLDPKMSDDEIKEVLRQAFISVENGFMDSNNDLLAERLSYDVPDDMNPYEIYNQKPEILEHIKKINYHLSSGTAAAICLIYNNKLYVANVGTCRVLLCQTDPNGVLKVVQLSVDHDLKNEDELLRLSQIGLNINNAKQHSLIGNQTNTRCLGNYLVKAGYKELEDLMMASQEPIIAEPDITDGINLDESHRFLLLMTTGLYKSIEDTMATDQVNKYIAQCVVEQFKEQATLTGVAQAVVDKVVRLHHDWYTMGSLTNCTKREDITLLVRNFNFPLPNAIKSPTTPTVSFNPIVSSATLSTHTTLTNSYNYSTNSSNATETNSTSGNEDQQNETKKERIAPYVNFDDFYKNVKLAKANGTLPAGIDI